MACSKCAGPHKANDCEAREFKCVNCNAANNHFGLNLATAHHAWSRNCAVLQKRIKKLKEYVQYKLQSDGIAIKWLDKNDLHEHQRVE